MCLGHNKLFTFYTREERERKKDIAAERNYRKNRRISKELNLARKR